MISGHYDEIEGAIVYHVVMQCIRDYGPDCTKTEHLKGVLRTRAE